MKEIRILQYVITHKAEDLYEEVKQIHDYRVPRNNDDFCVLSPAASAPTPNHSHNVIKWKQAVIGHPLSAICKFYCFTFCFVSLKEVSRSTIRKKVQITLTDDAKKTSCL